MLSLCTSALLLLTSLAFLPAPAGGQERGGPHQGRGDVPESVEDPQARSGGGSMSLPVPADHWVHDALGRLDGMAAGGVWTPWGFGTPSRAQVLTALEAVAAQAGTEPVRLLARSYRARFLQEIGRDRSPEDGASETIRWVDGSADLRVGRRSGALRAGSGYYELREPEAFGEDVHLFGEVGGVAAVGPAALSGRIRTDERAVPRVTDLHLAGTLGGVDLWLGRRAPAFGVGRGGTVVLDGAVWIDGGGLQLSAPVRLPWVLEHAGPVRFETHLARMDESGDRVRSPWFWAARGSVAPHERVSLGLNRAALFGGEGSPPTTFRNVALMLLGTRQDEPFSEELGRSTFSNQVLSVDLRVRAELGTVPTAFYLEWGMEDGSGAWKNVPAIVAGVELPLLPGIPEVSVGLEHAHFARSCCGNPMWYRHAQFSGGWADDGVPLGHPLGGHGDEWLLHGRVDLLNARLRSSWRLFRRDRGFENLFAPNREGTSTGGAVRAAYRLDARLDLVVDAGYERGGGDESWQELRAFFGVRAYF